jgi:undecaprenyl-diphosphatase
MNATPTSTTLRQRLGANEARLCVRANALCDRDAVRASFAAISRLGDGVFWYLLMAGFALSGGLRGIAIAIHLALTGAIALTLYKGLKRWTRRPRPCATHARIRARVAPLDEFSFPSGHTLHAVAFTCVALSHMPVLAWLLVPFAASVAASRVVLGLHYPSDVLAAIGIGGGLAWFMCQAFDALLPLHGKMSGPAMAVL